MWRGLLSVYWLGSALLCAQPASLEQAAKLYHHTEYENSLRLLLAMPDKNGPVYDLIGRNQLMPGSFKKGSKSHQQAIAERRKDYGKAEEQLRRAMQAAPTQVGRVVDLAKFLSKQGRIEESEQTFRAAERLAPNNPRLLYNRAETYIKAGRNIETAREL